MDPETRTPAVHVERAGDIEIRAFYDVGPTGPYYFTHTHRSYSAAGEVRTSTKVLESELGATANAMKRMGRWLEANPLARVDTDESSEGMQAQ